MSETPSVKFAVQGLAEARERHKRQAAVVKELEKALEKTWEGQHLAEAKHALDNLREQLGYHEEQLRAAARKEYRYTGKKDVVAGVSIKVYKTLRYDLDAALAWAKEHAPALVLESLDKKGFEKVALTLGAPVEEVEEPRVMIAQDLREWL